MASSSYATLATLQTYMKDVPVDKESAILTTLLSVASRVIDQRCGQYFYSDGTYARYFDGIGLSEIDTGQHGFFGKIGTIAACAKGATSLTYTPNPVYGGPAPVVGDVFTMDLGAALESVTVSGVAGSASPYTLTVGATASAHAASTKASTIQLALAFFENQPVAQWTTQLAGDGIAPGSNYFLAPRNRRNAESTASPSATRPWYGVDIATIPVSGTSYLPSSIPGKMTVSITATWGWPAVPDIVQDLTCKIAARAWRARESGWSHLLGSTDVGVVSMLRFFDDLDQMILKSSDLVYTAF